MLQCNVEKTHFTIFPLLGFSQGIRRAVGGLATIMGPLWAGSTVEMGYVMFGVMTFLFAFVIVSMEKCFSYLVKSRCIKGLATLLCLITAPFTF